MKKFIREMGGHGHRHRHGHVWGLVHIVFLLLWLQAWGKEPDILYLTWLRDPTTTMTIQWHAPTTQSETSISYRMSNTSDWKQATGTSCPFTDSDTNVHTIELTHLVPNTCYQFRFEPEGKIYLFQTLPPTLNERTVRFVTAGDAYMHDSLFKKLNQQIASTQPDFVIVGGDIAYTHGFRSLFSNKKWQIRRWQRFLREWTHTMVTPDGKLIPMLAVLGNHDIRTQFFDKTGEKQAFFQLFAMPQKGQAYRAYTLGNYLGITLLDTGHHSPIKGEQTEWLRRTLKEQYALSYRMAAYHMAAYPSVYRASKSEPTLIRNHWVPLFEQGRVQTAFEHHNHAYKRTYPLKEGRVDPTGVLYLGDGCWGVPSRRPSSSLNYIEKAAQINHFWLTTLSLHGMTLEAIDSKGHTFDKVAI